MSSTHALGQRGIRRKDGTSWISGIDNGRRGSRSHMTRSLESRRIWQFFQKSGIIEVVKVELILHACRWADELISVVYVQQSSECSITALQSSSCWNIVSNLGALCRLTRGATLRLVDVLSTPLSKMIRCLQRFCKQESVRKTVREICGIGSGNQWTPPGMFTACMAISACESALLVHGLNP